MRRIMELAAIEQANLLCDMDQKTGSLVPWHVQEGVARHP